MTKQLRLLSGGELPKRTPRPRAATSSTPVRPASPVVRMDARTRQIGRSGVAEARRRLAEIMATPDGPDGRAGELVKAS